MALTSASRWRDYSSACGCSTGSSRRADAHTHRHPTPLEGEPTMTDRHAELDAALERVISAARDHLVAVKAAEGRTDDDQVWRAYVELNNASFDYDELLLDAFGEVTPWDVDAIDPDEADKQFGVGADGADADDPHPRVVSVRQRRDYRVPSVAALLRLAESARRAAPHTDEEATEPVESVGEALLELMQAGDGSLG